MCFESCPVQKIFDLLQLLNFVVICNLLIKYPKIVDYIIIIMLLNMYKDIIKLKSATQLNSSIL